MHGKQSYCRQFWSLGYEADDTFLLLKLKGSKMSGEK